MQYELKEIKTEERKLVFRLEDSDPCAFHLIGYMRGDYGKTGDRFYHTWFGNDDSKNDAAFKSELAMVIDSLRTDEMYPVLRDYYSQKRFCISHPQMALNYKSHPDNYCVKVETERYSFYIRFILQRGNYNFYVFCYDACIRTVI